MKGNRLDELFRNGLESHKVAAPQSAWDKIEAGLPQKNRKGAYFWISIAASTVLLAAIGWLALNSQNATEVAPQEILSENPQDINENTTAQKDDNPELEHPKMQEPAEIITPAEDKVAQLPNLVAEQATDTPSNFTDAVQTDLNTLSNESFELKIEPIRLQSVSLQSLTANHSGKDFQINTQALMESIMLSRQEFEQLEGEHKKKFGFLEGIVSMAKGMNNGAKALSEIRKSKNEFITNDLKYGDKTESTSQDQQDEEPNHKQY